MKKSYKFDPLTGVLEAKVVGVKYEDIKNSEYMSESLNIQNQSNTIGVVKSITVDISLNPILQFVENEAEVEEEGNIVNVTEVSFMDGRELTFLIPFQEFKQLFYEYKRVVFN